VAAILMARSTKRSQGRSRRSGRSTSAPAWFYDELAFAWRTAQDDAASAYRVWSSRPGPDAYAAYRAAQDRADAAQDALTAEESR
jgi:hypothetical protein